MDDNFRTAINRLFFGGVQGAIGGAAVGAVVGMIFMSVRQKAVVGADASKLPVPVDYLWQDSELLEMTLAVLDSMPPSAVEHRRALVSCVDQLIGCQHVRGRGTIVKANRYFQHISRILRHLKSSDRAAELHAACDNMIHNMCLE